MDHFSFPADLPRLATLLAALGSGLIGGVFFAFSTFVMQALARLPPAQGMAAMQHINVTVLNPLFLGVFMGTALLCLVLGGWTVLRWPASGGAWLVAGCVLYAVGTFGVTVACNVPLNDRLAAIQASDPQAAAMWQGYLRDWTRWNHARTLAALAAAGVLTMGWHRLSTSAAG